MPTLLRVVGSPRNLRARAPTQKHAQIGSGPTSSCPASAPFRRSCLRSNPVYSLTPYAFRRFRGDRLRLWRCVPHRRALPRIATRWPTNFFSRGTFVVRNRREQLVTNQWPQLVFCSFVTSPITFPYTAYSEPRTPQAARGSPRSTRRASHTTLLDVRINCASLPQTRVLA